MSRLIFDLRSLETLINVVELLSLSLSSILRDFFFLTWFATSGIIFITDSERHQQANVSLNTLLDSISFSVLCRLKKIVISDYRFFSLSYLSSVYFSQNCNTFHLTSFSFFISFEYPQIHWLLAVQTASSPGHNENNERPFKKLLFPFFF